MDEEVTLTQFELGQLMVALGTTQFNKLTPEFQAKLSMAFRNAEKAPDPLDKFNEPRLEDIKLATDE